METYIIITVILLAAFLYVLYQRANEKLSEAKLRNEDYEFQIHQLNMEKEALTEELAMLSKNRRKTDEKINELHTGDAADNAINGLCKH